jgi:hypothetical protein
MSARDVIDRLGGTRAVARELKLTPSVVQSWKERNVIPARRQRDLLNLGRKLGKYVEAVELIPPAGMSAA